MLNMKYILFSRTLTNDYRWIFTNDKLGSEEKSKIRYDMKAFENNRDFYLSEPHLIIRMSERSLSLYKFVKFDKCDRNSREIFGLVGVSFDGYDFEIANALLPHIVAYYYSIPFVEDILREDISDDAESLDITKSVSIDEIVDFVRYREPALSLMNEIIAFRQHQPTNCFQIAVDGIKQLKDKPISGYSTQQYNQKMDELLNNANQFQIKSPPPKPIFDTKESSKSTLLYRLFSSDKNKKK